MGDLCLAKLFWVLTLGPATVRGHNALHYKVSMTSTIVLGALCGHF